MKYILPLILPAILLLAACGESHSHVTADDLEAAIKAGTVTVIDVNGTNSFNAGHIPGAIDFEANADKLEGLLPEDKGAMIVAYCGGPMCPAYKDGLAAAEKLGYTNLQHYSGGISGWKKAGKELEKAEEAAPATN